MDIVIKCNVIEKECIDISHVVFYHIRSNEEIRRLWFPEAKGPHQVSPNIS